MSNNLTIPAAVWACKVDGVPLVAGIVDGEECCPFFRSGQHEYQSHRRQMRPPADLVALRDARCATCGGRGFNMIQLSPTSQEVGWCTNPRCHDGRLLHDVRVECASAYHDMTVRRVHGECHYCRDGHRTVKGLVDVVPVVDICDPRALSSNGQALVVMDDGGVALVDAEHELDLTPAHVAALGTIQPGQWAWTFTEVEA